jgi:hypothetical protein
MVITLANGICALPKKDVFRMGKADTNYFTQVKEGGAEGPGTWQRADSHCHAPLLLQHLAPQRILSLTRTCPQHPHLYLSPKAVLPSMRFCGRPPLHLCTCLHRLPLLVLGPPVSKVSGLK